MPAESLATFPSEFQQGMAAHANYIGDVGESTPENWEAPLGSKTSTSWWPRSRDACLMEALVRLAQDAVRNRPGVTPVWTLDVHVPATDGREQFGFKDSMSEPAVEGTDILGSNPHEAPLKAGEFMGYQDETGDVSPVPQPEVLGRNGTYVAFRKLHQRVAAFREYLGQNAATPSRSGLPAEFVGRWPSGAPLALAADKDDPDLGADPARNNAFMYGDDPRGLKCPVGAPGG